MTITICWFKRNKRSTPETGVMIDEEKLILDKAGNPVKAPVWTYELQPYKSRIILDLN
jgi:hypothetical protein